MIKYTRTLKLPFITLDNLMLCNEAICGVALSTCRARIINLQMYEVTQNSNTM